MVIQVKRSLEGKDSYSLKDDRERLEADNRARSSHDTRNLNPYDEEMDGRSCKRREKKHDKEGRKDKCHVPNPHTGEEDMTNTISIWENSPKNMISSNNAEIKTYLT